LKKKEGNEKYKDMLNRKKAERVPVVIFCPKACRTLNEPIHS
jgi:hypothetical protein